MSDHPNAGADAGGGGQTPAANQTETEATPTSDAQSAPPAGNLSSANPQAPTPMVTSAAGGVPRPAPTAGYAGAGRPGTPEPDAADSSRPATADGGGVHEDAAAAPAAGKPDGEVSG